MARRGDVNVGIHVDDDQALKAFDAIGDGAKDMGRDVDRATSDVAEGGFGKLGGAIDDSEGKFRGLGDTIGGTGDIMAGFKEGNIVGVAMGFADLAGGISSFVVPALTAMKGAILTGLAPALTAISAHPLIAAILAGGAIIAGLILLEKKFGVVSGAINALKDAFSSLWDLIKKGWNATLGGLKFGFDIPSWIPGVGGKSWHVQIPEMHSGGIVPGPAGMDVLRVLQAGETVIPRGQSSNGGQTIVVNVSGVGMGRDFGDAVARALRDNKLIGVTI